MSLRGIQGWAGRTELLDLSDLAQPWRCQLVQPIVTGAPASVPVEELETSEVLTRPPVLDNLEVLHRGARVARVIGRLRIDVPVRVVSARRTRGEKGLHVGRVRHNEVSPQRLGLRGHIEEVGVA